MRTEEQRRERRHLVAYILLAVVIALAFSVLVRNFTALREETHRAQASECKAVEILRQSQIDGVNALADFAESGPAFTALPPQEQAERRALIEKARTDLVNKIGPAHRTCPPLS